ncbi:MAG: hypothetical protein U0Q11_08965 [Vicinamibacterales bacterium]
MSRIVLTTDILPEPTIADLDGVMSALRRSWTARITIRRPAIEDIAFKDIFVSLDGESLGLLCPGQEISREVVPGPHRIRVHNTLFWRTYDLSVQVSEHAGFVATNRPGFGTFSILAYFLGTNLVYLTLERDELLGHR